VPVNGQLITSVNIREKKLLKPKKKRKAQCSDKEVPKDLLLVEKDKLQEEEGVWQTKISSREKRHLRKERLKQKEDPSRASLGSSAVEPAFGWDEKGAVWPLTEDTSGGGKGALVAKAECGTVLKASGAIQEESVPSQSEEDVFCNVGTWDIAEVKSCPVTFGTLPELSRELGSSEVSIYTPVVGRPYPALAGMMSDEPSRSLLALAALIALTTGEPRVSECIEEKRLRSSCFSAQR
ncbi:PREDICTED: uncharacterized protein LOC103915542, partial [Pygoscelis adeliae]|uniref:uncharacterized protein LOC103915542 n=1 Tax=Pygoscelis adeliae TaxID=9238 RepID=UPI0004F4E6E6